MCDGHHRQRLRGSGMRDVRRLRGNDAEKLAKRGDSCPPLTITSRVSFRSVGSVLSVLSLLSGASILSIGSAGSILSIGSTGSILSIGSVGSILSIGSVGALGGIGARGRKKRRGDREHR